MALRYYYKEGTDWIYFGFNYDPEIVEAIKEIKGAKYNPENKEWYIRLDGVNNYLVRDIIDRYQFENEHIYRPNNNLYLPEIENPLACFEVAQAIKELGLYREPRQYQIEGVTYMINHGNCINGDDCGLGKTGQMIITLELLGAFPAIIVTPASVKYGWRVEWSKWCQREIEIIDSTNKDINMNADVYVINYDILGEKYTNNKVRLRFPELLDRHWSAAVFDEIHFLKSANSVRTRAAYKLVKNSDDIFGLSGTLAMNRPVEVKQPLIVIKRFNDIFPDVRKFELRYCNAKATEYGWDVKSSNNLIELNSILRHFCYIRREKRDVLKELPPVADSYIYCDISNKREYRKAENDLIDYLSEIDIERAQKAQNAKHLVMLSTLRKLSIKGKIKAIEVFLKEWMESNEGKKILVFGHHREPLQDLSKRFDSLLLQGGTNAKKKQQIKEKFMESKVPVLFANIESAGTGMDGLQEVCSNIVFIEFPDRSTDLDQAISRLERMGQQESMNVYYTICKDTIDMHLLDFINSKRKVTEAVNKGKELEDSEAVRFLLDQYKRKK